MPTYLDEDLVHPLARILGNRLRETRRARKMTQSALAEHVGLGPAYISMIECGRSNPTLEVMGALAAALGVTVPDLLIPLGSEESKPD